MSRGATIVRNVAAGLVALILLALLATLIVIRTEWFRSRARQEIISATEDSTGGRVEIGSLGFDASHLRAMIGDFVIHGREPAGVTPLLRVHSIVAEIRLFPRLTRLVDLSYLGVGQPEANIVILPDGRSNIPVPKNNPSQQSALKTVVDLAVGRFELSNGLVALELQKVPLNFTGNDLHAQLTYNALSTNYRGEISFSPLYVVSGRKTPVSFRIALPLTIGSDRIDLHKASISSGGSTLSIDGSFENVQSPRINAQISGTVAVADLRKLADLPLAADTRGSPAQIQLAASVTASSNSIQVARLQTNFGASSIEASGPLKDARGNGALTFRATVDLGELDRLIKVGAKAQGTATLDGTARLNPDNSYSVTGDLQARHLEFQQGTTRIREVGLSAAINANQDNLQLDALKVTAFGGQFDGSASMQNFQAYRVKGDLRHLDLASLLSPLREKLPYDAVISGPVTAEGNTKSANSLVAQARLSITPGSRGIPVSGRLNADYNEARNDLIVGNSYLVLPHSRLDLNGALDKAINVSLTTSDLSDFLSAASVKGQPVALNHGSAAFTGTLLGGLRAPRITGHLAANKPVVEERQFDSLAADVSASNSAAPSRTE